MKKKRIEYRYRFDGLFMCMSSLKKYRAPARAAAPCSEQSHHAKLVSSWMRHGCRVTWCPHGVTQQALGAATKDTRQNNCADFLRQPRRVREANVQRQIQLFYRVSLGAASGARGGGDRSAVTAVVGRARWAARRSIRA